MKRNIYVLWIAIVAAACSTMGKSEKSILEYMREQTGSPKLDIEFTDVKITKQTVGDSINILQGIYEQNVKEREEKMQKLEKGIKEAKNNLKSGKGNDPMILMFYDQQLKMSEREYKSWEEKEFVNEKMRYDGRNKDEVIATVVSCRMTSLVNPVLNAKQTKEGDFLLTADESRCIRQLK